MQTARILVVEDEQDICEILKFNLESEGFSVSVANSAEEALTMKPEKFDLFLLDIMMGKMSGFRLAEVLKKERKIEAPVIFLTARDTENDTLTGFSLGADDYISKPFSIREVIARVKAILNRASKLGKKEENITIGEMMIDVFSKKVMVKGQTVILTKKEFEILLLLAGNIGKVFSRETIMDYVWKDDVVVNDRTIDVHIARLRKKMADYGKAFVNRSGHGYCFEPEKLLA
ncbi:response regulator transcription factor [Alkalitalea saponilacus]|uniref:DNA-binding response regulator, OmpR family, contains REC and winged-helix (WHTH) domain n=1 Tax=Alkalitalea saponilacus TaxID=889453 RepID=A0A1T5A1V2_9BACT|nr:response regulator transcription factor [Alkalitalea saponilacus]ASB48923.1 DNA-binding response regulator [Alkalitalea saponilacus]SKB28613.1 DNA-binding response regulator, OmpR family, contains REC and winged-helix (wHTH) domain [Alkalitalea saponilacus]